MRAEKYWLKIGRIQLFYLGAGWRTMTNRQGRGGGFGHGGDLHDLTARVGTP
jgi:hypothetical protein